MNFLVQHPNYNTYENDTFKMSSIPRYGFANDLNGLVHSLVMKNQEDEINYAAWRLQNKLAAKAQMSPCDQTFYNVLIEEIGRTFRTLESKGFPYLMDGLAILVEETNDTEEINDFLENKEIGYVASLWRNEVEWLIREGTEDQAESLVESLEIIEIDYRSTREHIQQAISQLQSIGDSRSRKDALRDALSAIEAYVNSISGETDFHKSFKTLSQQIDAPVGFIRDGQSLWSKIHELHPDIRHGNESHTVLEMPDALYYIDRLMAYIKYIHRKKS